jgi:hypothetical protein
MGKLDNEGGPTVEDERERRAFRVLQFQLQYLLYSHQALQQRVEDAEQVSGRTSSLSPNSKPSFFELFLFELELDECFKRTPFSS